MSSKEPPAPARDPDETILCIEDLKKSAVKKLPHGIRGRCVMNHLCFEKPLLSIGDISDRPSSTAMMFQIISADIL